MTGRFDFDFCRHLNVQVIDEGKGCLQHSSYCLGSNLVIYVTVLQGPKRLTKIGWASSKAASSKVWIL